MYQLINKCERKQMGWLVNGLVFLFFVTVLAFPKGYSIAPMALAIIGVIYLFVHLFVFKKKLNPTREDKWLIFAFVFYFSTFALSAIIHGDGFREIDNPSRVLLFLPLLLLFREFPLNIKTILYGIPVGAAVAGIIAIYQKFYLGLILPFPQTSSIQSGDIAITLGCFSLSIALYWINKGKYKLTLFSLICSILGLVASILSEARGGWIALPFIFMATFYLYRKFLNLRIIGILSILIILIVTTFASSTSIFNIIQRYEVAKKDITLYLDKKEKYTSIGARFDMWENAIIGFKEKPILGWGNKGYQRLKEEQVSSGKMAQSTLEYNDAHNQYLDSLIKRGIVGLLGVIILFIIPLHFFTREKVDSFAENILVMSLGIITILSVGVFSLTQTFLAHNSGLIFYSFLVVILLSFIKGGK